MDGNDVDIVVAFMFGAITATFIILECVKEGIIKKENFE